MLHLWTLEASSNVQLRWRCRDAICLANRSCTANACPQSVHGYCICLARLESSLGANVMSSLLLGKTFKGPGVEIVEQSSAERAVNKLYMVAFCMAKICSRAQLLTKELVVSKSFLISIPDEGLNNNRCSTCSRSSDVGGGVLLLRLISPPNL